MYASVEPHFTRQLLSPGLRVGYTDEGGVWQFLAPSLMQRLPLRGIEWRNLVGVTKCINQLPLYFMELSIANITPKVPFNWIYLVKCEDFDTYKHMVRPAIATWVDAMTVAQIEWLLLYVPMGTHPKTAGNVPHPIYRKIFDKLKTDFGQKKNSSLLGPTSGGSSSVFYERVCKIDTLEGTSIVGQQQQHESQWTELVMRLKCCIMSAFELKCFQYEEKLRILDGKRNAVGWNFGDFFVAKERLALMYQDMYLQDDAIRHLDELDAIFVNLNETEKQVFQDNSKTCFEWHDPVFTQSPLALDLSEIQQSIASNCASTRLVSLYCFCRQIRTLYVMGNFPQLLKRASSFIEFFLAELKELAAEGKLKWYQPFLWAVGACMEVSYACELSWSGRDEEWTASSVSVQVAQAIPVEEMSRALGNVLYLARRVLKNFAKCRKSRNDSHMPFTNLSDVDADADDAEASITWYQELEQVFVAAEWRRSETCDSYERCLSEVSHLASMHFSQSGRHRFAVYLGGECAQYHLARGEFESALRLLRSLARQSEEDGWWTIFGFCVRSICRAELALGRSAQAVAAFFSMLRHAQKEQVSVSKEEMKELLITLVTYLESNGDADNSVNSVVDTEKSSSMSEINLGELLRPSMTVETTQASSSELEHGDIRVTLVIANDFPAGVDLDKVCARFSTIPESHESSFQKDVLHHDDLGWNEDRIAGASVEHDKNTILDADLTSKHDCSHRSKTKMVDSATTPDDTVENVGGEHKHGTELLLEKRNIHLDEKTGVNLVFLHSGVPVGQYTCTGIECVIAGSTFYLFPPSALFFANFEIAAKERAVHVGIDGAPLLIPRPLSEVETIAVSIRANDNMVVNGILELRVFRRIKNGNCDNNATQGNEEKELEEGGSGSEEGCGVHLIGIQRLDESDTTASLKDTKNNHVASHEECDNLLSVALPTLFRGELLRYAVTVTVPPIDSTGSSSERENEDNTIVTVRASVRYQRERVNANAPITTTEIRYTESIFRLLQPLTEEVQLRRVGTRIFASIALVCNPFISVVLRHYCLRCPGQVGNASVHDPVIAVEQDPNTKLRGTNLRPNDRVYLAFTLACSPAFEKESSDSYCSLELDLKYDADETWLKTMAIHVPLKEVEGKRYRIDVLPKGQDEAHTFMGELVEATVSKPVTFQIHVQEEVSHSNMATMADDTDTLSLCLNESSEDDWILVGKQLECFNLGPCLESHGNRRREFTTQKRLLATRSGILRFPGFHLEVNGQTIPVARVHCQQSCRQVIVS
ncbi:hypothetical protein KXD40_000639 [Peronospora effusa]|nr:hypothetical protein KXD40_000639 [Peronospora effusa]CAI5723449.1 unnamed protein product [Peronospora effusa]